MACKINQDISIGENLRILRKQAGYSQEEVAVQLQIMGLCASREIISQIELGHHNITVKMLLALKRLYNVTSFDEFFANLELD